MEKSRILMVCLISILILFISNYTSYFMIEGVSYPAVYLNSTSVYNRNLDNLTCYASSTSDAENVNYNGFWYKNGDMFFYETNSTFGGTGNEYALGAVFDSQNNLIVAGSTDSFGVGGSDMLIVKYNSSGIQTWNITLGGASTDNATSVAVDMQDNIIACGSTTSFGLVDSQFWIAKFDSNGLQMWNRTFGGSNNDVCNAIKVDSENNIVLAGTEGAAGPFGPDFWVVSYNSSGNYTWNTTSGNVFDSEYAYGLAIDSNGNITVVGTNRSGGNNNINLIRYNSSGAELWGTTIGGADDDQGKAIAIDSLQNIIVAGYTASFGAGGYDYWILKFDSEGSLIWNRTFGTTSGDVAYSVAVNSEDDVIATGYWAIGSNIFTVAFNSSGNYLWNKSIGGGNLDQGNAIAISNQDNILVAGKTLSFGEGNYDAWILRYSGFVSENNLPNIQVPIGTLNQTYTSNGESWFCRARSYNSTNYSAFYEGTNYTMYNTSLNVSIAICGINPCECGNTLDRSRTMNLEDNLTACTSDGLIISVNGINLDCNGTLISGNRSYLGIKIQNNLNNTNISNCTINGFFTAINITGGQNTTEIIYNNISNNTFGIFSYQNVNMNISNNIITNSGNAGIYLLGSNNSIVNNNTIREVSFGCTTFRGFATCPNAPCAGVYSSNTLNSNITFNNIINVSNSSIQVCSNTANVTVSNNTLCDNRYGIMNYTALKLIGDNAYCVRLLSPQNNTIFSLYSAQSFTYNVSDLYLSGNTNCTLSFCGIQISNSTTIRGRQISPFTFCNVYNSSGYFWNVTCTDKYNNIGMSENWYLYNSYICGDGYCGLGENCSNCWQDCGNCYSGGSQISGVLMYDEENTPPFVIVDRSESNTFENLIPDLQTFYIGETLKKVNIAFGNNSMEIRVNDLYSFLGFRKDGRFNFVFELSPKVYAAHCYNRYIDSDETNTDCGGGCAPCIEVPGTISSNLKNYLWGLEIILISAIIIMHFSGRRNEMSFVQPIKNESNKIPFTVKIASKGLSPKIEVGSAKVEIKKKVRTKNELGEINRELGRIEADIDKFNKELKKV